MPQGPSQLIRIIPGDAGEDYLTALILSQTNLQLTIELQHAIPDASVPRVMATAPVSGATKEQPVILAGHAPSERLIVSGLAQIPYENQQIRVYHIRAEGLRPSTGYVIEARDGDEWTSQAVTTFGSHLNPFRIGVWSCYHHEAGSGERLAEAIKSQGIHMKLLVGDNIYLDQPLRLENPITEVPRRYLERIFSSAYAEALAIAPTYTTWDDHEFWNNYPQDQVWLKQSKGALATSVKDEATKALDLFQHTLNVGVAALDQNKTHRSFAITGTPHVSFFVLDVRSQRELDKDGTQKMMPDAALSNFKDWAENLKRPGILVLGQPLWIGAGDYFDYNPPRFQAQYNAIWEAIVRAPFDIFVLSGDVHHSRLIRLELRRGDRQCTVYECLSTPANHIPEGSATVAFPGELDRSFRIPGQPRLYDPGRGGYIMGTDSRSTFAILEITPTGSSSVDLQVTFYDMEGRGSSSLPVVAKNESAAITTKIVRSRTKETRRYEGFRPVCISPWLHLSERPSSHI